MPELNSWPPWTVRALRLLVAPPATVGLVDEAPRVVDRIPPLPPVAQSRSPTVVVAERMMGAGPGALDELSRCPRCRWRRRGRAPDRPVPGPRWSARARPARSRSGAALYPVTAMKRPSDERSIRPSERDWPVAVSRVLPSAVVCREGDGLDRVPADPYSSRNTGAAALVNGAAPVPTR